MRDLLNWNKLCTSRNFKTACIQTKKGGGICWRGLSVYWYHWQQYSDTHHFMPHNNDSVNSIVVSSLLVTSPYQSLMALGAIIVRGGGNISTGKQLELKERSVTRSERLTQTMWTQHSIPISHITDIHSNNCVYLETQQVLKEIRIILLLCLRDFS